MLMLLLTLAGTDLAAAAQMMLAWQCGEAGLPDALTQYCCCWRWCCCFFTCRDKCSGGSVADAGMAVRRGMFA
jgi:hypothetical protein